MHPIEYFTALTTNLWLSTLYTLHPSEKKVWILLLYNNCRATPLLRIMIVLFLNIHNSLGLW